MAKRKNIIFYFSDQQRWDTVNETVTPNLMQLAKEGTLFENNFTCQPGFAARLVPACKPVCMLPSAAATGTAFPCRKALPRWPITLTKPGMTLLMWASGTWPLTGYRGSAPTARPRRYRKKSRASTATGGQRMCWNLPATATTATSLTATATKLDFTGYRADCINDFALEYLESGREADKPFFLFISQLEPHHQNDHHHYEGYKETVNQYKDYPLPPDLTFLKGDYKEMYPDYISAINRLDYNVGRLVQKLKDLGIYDDTVIIYSSDHGSHFKTRNLEYKRSCHDSATHTPLIIKGGGFDGGKAENRLTSLIDLPPTFLSLAGIPIPPSYMGKVCAKCSRRHSRFTTVCLCRSAKASAAAPFVRTDSNTRCAP